MGQCVQECPERISAALQAGAERFSAQLGIHSVSIEVAHLIDHTLLKPDATVQQVSQLCHEALLHRFASVCINPTHVKLAANLLQNSDIKVCTVVGFPLGATSPQAKAFETEQALADGATEIDMVINIGALKGGDDEMVRRDIAGVAQAAHRHGALCKVIIETALLTEEEKIRACQLAKEAGADFVKTSTGFSGGGATIEDVQLMRQVVGPKIGVKASGGIRNLADAKNMIAAGATRLGASAGVKIVQEAHSL
ncbi:MAG: deoxyribose-phosphate aldolase [Anaerolineae bacterium]|nr:deoxyribose-phosphate aldolase [Anaerolineae bacterium]